MCLDEDGGGFDRDAQPFERSTVVPRVTVSWDLGFAFGDRDATRRCLRVFVPRYMIGPAVFPAPLLVSGTPRHAHDPGRSPNWLGRSP